MENSKIVNQLKSRLADASHEIYSKKLVKFGEGNLSLRVLDQESMIITPSRNDYEKCEPKEMILMNYDGSFQEGSMRPSSEFRLHKAIYTARPKVKAIIHTHSPYVSMMAVCHEDLPIIIEEMALFLGYPVKCAEYGQAGTDNLPKNALNALGNGNCAILANHGLVVCGRSMEDCLHEAILVEKMARIYLGAKQSGNPVGLDEKNIRGFREMFISEFSTL
ncbi:MAG: class II aldolase/adducin family protein [Promethearchaeota archaeon]